MSVRSWLVVKMADGWILVYKYLAWVILILLVLLLAAFEVYVRLK